MSQHNSGSNQSSRRRRLLKWIGGLGIVTFLGSLLVPLKDLGIGVGATEDDEESEESKIVGQRLVFAHAHEQEPGGHEHTEGAIVNTDHLSAPDAALVYPENLSQEDKFLINIHKFDPDLIESPTITEWTDQGFVAYSAICTHLGCTASWTEKEHEVGRGHDHCPCHVGEFDPYKGAEVVGGPPPRPLPQIGVKVNDDNELEITTEFEEEVGGE